MCHSTDEAEERKTVPRVSPFFIIQTDVIFWFLYNAVPGNNAQASPCILHGFARAFVAWMWMMSQAKYTTSSPTEYVNIGPLRIKL